LKRAAIEHEGQSQRAALADEGDAAFERFAHHLVRPERGAIEKIDESVAVRPEVGKRPRVLFQLRGQRTAVVGGCFAEPGSEADKAAGVARRERSGDPRYLAFGDSDEPAAWAPIASVAASLRQLATTAKRDYCDVLVRKD
jgi:hypothetical protein